MDFRGQDRGRIETESPLSSGFVRIDGRDYPVGPITGSSETPEEDEPPSEESVRFHEDQIERFEQNIERNQSNIVAMQAQIEIHQQWLDEHFPYRGIGMTDNDLYVIRDALTRSLQANDGIPYGLSVKEVYRKINNQIAINEANLPRNYPEMMKYPGKITVGDNVGGFTKND
jgi:hypothetical protein